LHFGIQDQGVQCRSVGDPVLNLRNPEGSDRATRRKALDALAAANQQSQSEFGDPETATRIAQYETSV